LAPECKLDESKILVGDLGTYEVDEEEDE